MVLADSSFFRQVLSEPLAGLCQLGGLRGRSLTEATWDTALCARAYLHNTGAPTQTPSYWPRKGKDMEFKPWVTTCILYVHRQTPCTYHAYIHTHAVIQYVTMHACTIQTHTHTDHVYIYILTHCRGRRTSDPAIYCVKHSHERTMYGCSHLEFPLTSDGLSAASQLPVNSQPYNHHTYSVWGENSLIYIKYNKNS